MRWFGLTSTEGLQVFTTTIVAAVVVDIHRPSFPQRHSEKSIQNLYNMQIPSFYSFVCFKSPSPYQGGFRVRGFYIFYDSCRRRRRRPAILYRRFLLCYESFLCPCSRTEAHTHTTLGRNARLDQTERKRGGGWWTASKPFSLSLSCRLLN